MSLMRISSLCDPFYLFRSFRFGKIIGGRLETLYHLVVVTLLFIGGGKIFGMLYLRCYLYYMSNDKKIIWEHQSLT